MFENNEKDYIPILKDIFHFAKNEPFHIYPIIKNSDKISDLKKYMESNDNDNSKKISILRKLKSFFLLNKNLIPFFIKKYNSNSSNFYFPIINLYLSEDINEEALKFLEDFFNLLNSHISISKLSLEYIYQKLSIYYRNEDTIKLTESLLIRYLHLLQIFYKDIIIMENNQEELLNFEEKELNNYIYLNGYESGVALSLNLNSTNYNACFPPIDNGCSFFFWINLSDKLLEIYRKIYPKIEISLITINIGTNKFKLILKETKYLQIIIDESESNSIDLSSACQFNKWNNMCLIIEK